MNIPIIFLVLILSSCTSLVLSAKEDVLVLLKIKKQLGNPEFLSSWVDGFDFCNDSDVNYPGVGVSCTSTGRVRSLSINAAPMSYLFLANYVPFPQAICDLTELEFLSMSRFMGIDGSLPSCINKLTNLREIHIWRTSMGGPLPELGNLTKLTKLDLPQNSFTTIPPSLSKLPKLRSLNLYWNNLGGTIPPAIVHGPGAWLDLSENSLQGEIPRCYAWTDFSSIILSKNELSGDVSFLFGKHKTVTYIDLSFNHFDFDLSNIVEIPENLTNLDLSFNEIYGKVPASLATGHFSLDLKFNSLCGEIPQEMSQWSSSIFDQNRCLCGGPLPPCNNSASPPASAPALAPRSFGSTP
jgi:Leucine rich repeat/Leucine rich repeat N-terminal domain